ncbi:MAG: phage holin family protein [Patescibacteria group bacterium]|nr:phage holin family protein [Patescibacteria group bacterium]MDE2116383.1 phage holin family protein [Patescibacteria group bacterium]
MKIIIRILIIALTIMALPHIVSGIVVSGFYPALIAAVIFAILNLTIKPILKLITLPINILTLGLFGLVINSLLLWFVATFVNGFTIASFSAAFLGALIIAIVNWLVHLI